MTVNELRAALDKLVAECHGSLPVCLQRHDGQLHEVRSVHAHGVYVDIDDGTEHGDTTEIQCVELAAYGSPT